MKSCRLIDFLHNTFRDEVALSSSKLKGLGESISEQDRFAADFQGQSM